MKNWKDKFNSLPPERQRKIKDMAEKKRAEIIQLCPKCGEPYGDDPIWPSKDGSEICQMCWEAECSESWWRRVDVFVEAEENAELSRMVKERAGQNTVKVDIDEL